MSRRLPRVAFSSSAAALALVVLLPTAALACPDQGGSDGSGGSGHSQGEDRQGDHAKASKSNDAKGADESGSKDAKDSKGNDAKDSKGKDAKDGKDADSKDTTAGTGSGGTQDGHNPPGNNGTIKIDYPAPADSGHANRPHPGCAFQLRMFNFDANQYGTITFVGQAPTKLGTLLTQQHMLLSNDAAGGGQDVDEVYAYTAQQLGLIGKPQAKQGWHIKVSVNADNAPGGAKHKVFWLKCDETPAPAAGTSNSGGTTTAGGSTTQTTQTTQGAGTAQTSVPAQTTTGTTVPATTTTTSTTSATTSGAATAAGNATAASGFTGGSGTAAVTPAAPATRSAARPSALPFTGLALGSLIALALGILAAGFLAIRAGRRRGGAQL